MARIQESVEIKYPVEKVFAYAADEKAWPKWHLDMLEAERTSSGQIGVGTTFRGANRVMGRRTEWISKVTEYELDKVWVENITSGSMQFEERLLFDPVEGGTKLTVVSVTRFGGFLKLLSPMVACTMRKQIRESLSNLKSILEAQA
jgi:uncharacterized protein YndB with AHSA1/START domain